MSWLHRVQQRLSITKNEAMTLLSLTLFLLLGTAGRHMCRQVRPVSDEYYAEVDSLFAERSAAVFDSEGGANREDRRSDGMASPPVVPDTASRVERRSGAPAERPTPGQGLTPAPSLIDLNHATAQELDRLPRVGPKIAERIIAFREAYGPFRSMEELLGVSGIGPKTLEKIRPFAHVRADSLK